MDGMHRMAKARLLDHTETQAVHFLYDPEPDQLVSTTLGT
jgi:hypothetical protein